MCVRLFEFQQQQQNNGINNCRTKCLKAFIVNQQVNAHRRLTFEIKLQKSNSSAFSFILQKKEQKAILKNKTITKSIKKSKI